MTYWDEIKRIFEWSKSHVTSTLYICWAAQAGLYYHYGIPKYHLKKMFGIFEQYCLDAKLPIFRGFDDIFFMPHSRHTEIRKQDILNDNRLSLIAESQESGVSIVMANNGREFFITGHLEYALIHLTRNIKEIWGNEMMLICQRTIIRTMIQSFHR